VESEFDHISATTSPAELLPLLDELVRRARDGKSTLAERRTALRSLVLSPGLLKALGTGDALDALLQRSGSEDWAQYFVAAVDKELPSLLVHIVDEGLDVGHEDLLRLVPSNEINVLLKALKQLAEYVDSLQQSPRRLRGMRVSMICGAIFSRLQDDKIWRRRSVPACGIDGEQIAGLKEKKRFADLPAAYEKRVNQLQRADLRRSLEAVRSPAKPVPLPESDYDTLFEVHSPLRLGISSANASDNHIRSKEQGGKTLNVGIDLRTGDLDSPAPPLVVTVRRLPDPRVVLHSRSAEFEADFEINSRGDAAAQSGLFFAFRRGGDEALRMVKQALVHTGIVGADSTDVVGDIGGLLGGGGLEITTASTVQQGSGLGTSSILAAAILKALYRLTGNPAGTTDGEYPNLFDQSVLLEQSIGLNSGWQDARGARGGASAVKDFYAPPTDGLPTPELSYVDVDADLFRRRVVLFDTGIARAATRGLNVVMETYLARDRQRYGAIRESLAIHDRMVDALRAGDYAKLGQMASRYWALRCILDPEATNPAIQQLFESPVAELIEGGTLTGAGGGGFGLLIAREGEEDSLRGCLNKLKDQRAYARSAVVDYQLNATGLQLTERPASTADR
jgi:galactokinase/mevalonate kinase-like predicted kinase